MSNERTMYINNATFLRGAALGLKLSSPEFAEKLLEISDQLKEAGEHICAQGYFGCDYGENCDSDHK